MTTTMGSLDLSALNNLYDETQYFWFESSAQPWGAGAHVTLYPQSEFTKSTHANYLKGQNILMNTDGLSIRNGTLPMMTLDNDSLDFNVVDTINGTYTNVASFGGDTARIGKIANDSNRTEITSGGMQVLRRTNGTDLEIANFGYGTGNNASGGTASAPYYTLGTRENETQNYSSASTYDVGDMVTYNGSVYICIERIATPESFTPSHWSSILKGNYSCAEGYGVIAQQMASHAEGGYTRAMGRYSHAEGYFSVASGTYSHAEGNAIASGTYSHAEGTSYAIGGYAHAEGSANASGFTSHAEGGSIATGDWSHAEGDDSLASASCSHAQNEGTVADQANQTAIGQYNTKNNTNNLFVIGKGTGDSSRSDAFQVDTSGNTIMAGDITVKNHASPIGTRKVTTGSYSVASGNDYVTVPTDKLTRLSLEAGSWIITLSAQYSANATGRRGCAIYNVTAGSRFGRSETNQNAVSGVETRLQSTINVVLDTTSTITAQLAQNSGSARTCALVLDAMRIA